MLTLIDNVEMNHPSSFLKCKDTCTVYIIDDIERKKYSSRAV